jgi:hypothetical protein
MLLLLPGLREALANWLVLGFGRTVRLTYGMV